jgi:hypothetical protein
MLRGSNPHKKSFFFLPMFSSPSNFRSESMQTVLKNIDLIANTWKSSHREEQVFDMFQIPWRFTLENHFLFHPHHHILIKNSRWIEHTTRGEWLLLFAFPFSYHSHTQIAGALAEIHGKFPQGQARSRKGLLFFKIRNRVHVPDSNFHPLPT